MSATVTCPSWCNANGNQPCVGDHFRDIGSVKASGGDIMQRIEGPDDFPTVQVTVGFCESPPPVADDEPYITVGICGDVVERDIALRAGEIRRLITMLEVALNTIEEPTAEEKVDEARKVVSSLLAKHGITDPAHAKRLVRERFSDDELHQWKRALRALDGNGAIG